MRYKINLIPPKEETLIDTVIYFVLNYLRYILVLTQLVVIIVFFYRFQIDQLIIDLKDEIEQKKEIIQVAQPLKQEALIIEKRLKKTEELIHDQDRLINMVSYFLSLFPETVYLDKLEIINGELTASGLAYNVSHLQAFYKLLKKEEQFKTVDFSSIKKEMNGYSFTLKLSGFKEK
jgi:Tfp pilus assembly protein PilN